MSNTNYQLATYVFQGVAIFIMLLLYGFLGKGTVVAAEVTVSPETQRFINGQSELSRIKYFNICGGGTNFYQSCPLDEGDHLLNDLNISFGRHLGLMVSPTRSGRVREDPSRPGFADPSSVEAHYGEHRADDPRLKEKFRENLDIILHGRGNPFPAFMGKITYNNGEGYIAKNLDAAADYAVQCLKLRYTPYELPGYYEPLNEPDWGILNRPEFHQLHVAIARAVRNAKLNTLVGGPCMSVAYFFRRSYEGNWSKGLRPFIDAAGQDLDFISFHVYDFYSDEKQDITTGLPLESVFDLYENYTFLKFGAVKPFACSEHGATGGDFALANQPPGDRDEDAKGVVRPRSLLEWWHINSLNGQIMTFMDRPGTVLKAVPFTLVRTDAWNPRYLWSLYTREGFTRNGQFRRTNLFKFYQFWKDVKGRRIEAHCDDPDIQVRSFVHDQAVYLCLNNLADQPKELGISVSSNPRDVTITRCYREGDAPVLEEDLPLQNWDTIMLKGDEAAILKMHYPHGAEFHSAVNEHTFYGDVVAVPIQAEKPNVVTIRVPDTADVKYAYLRIGISRPHGLERTPEVTFNGINMKIPLEDSDEKQLKSPEYATAKIIMVPVDKLKDTNTVSIIFPDDGGAIGAVILVVASAWPGRK